MTEREALKLTLEALKQIDEAMPFPVAKLAIMEAEKALAQQCVCGEPNSAGTHRTDGPCLAPQRTWVGLDADEVFELASGRWTLGQMAVLVEAKLKEKNT